MTRKFEGSKLLFATHNAGKLEEMRELFEPFNVYVIGAADLDLPVPEETEDTFIGNARIKAVSAVQASGLPALADDSGIEVDGLNGAPGVYTADWAETENGRDFMMAMTKTHDLLEAAKAPHPRGAAFCATMVMAWPDGHEEVFEGRAHGTLVWPVRGALGHGYDPMFQPEGHDRTFAEMSHAEKNTISHRAVAFKQMIERLF